MPDLTDIVNPDGGTIDTGTALAMGLAGLAGVSVILGRLKSAVEDGSKLFTMARNGAFWAWRNLSISGMMHKEQEEALALLRTETGDVVTRLASIEASHAEIRRAVGLHADDTAAHVDDDAKRREALRLIADILGVPSGGADG
jgi:hypothetical protein